MYYLRKVTIMTTYKYATCDMNRDISVGGAHSISEDSPF